MRIIAQTTQPTKASPERIFALWSDVNNWASYDHGIEWAKLTEPFNTGARYSIKPKGGPSLKARILLVEPGSRFVDVSYLFGAKLTFDHSIVQKAGVASVSVVMSLTGPLSWLWVKILGKNQQADLEQATANLIAKAEQAS